MWDKYLYRRLNAEEKLLIDKLKLLYADWMKTHNEAHAIINIADKEHVRNNLDLIEVQLISLLKLLNFNRHLYVKEIPIFDEIPAKKHLKVCIKSFNLSLKELLSRHGIELKIKIQPLDEYIFELLTKDDQEQYNKMVKDDDMWGPFYMVDKDRFGSYAAEIPTTVGDFLAAPVKIQLQQWLAPWVATPMLLSPMYHATSGSCADSAQKYLMDWEEKIIQLLLNQIRANI